MIQPSTSASTQISGRQTVPPAPLKSFIEVQSASAQYLVLDHPAKNKLAVIPGTFTALHVLKLLSKWQTVRKAYKYYKPHFVDEEIKGQKQVTCCSSYSVRAGVPLPRSPPNPPSF